MAGYGYDFTGRKKGQGFFGPLFRPDGGISTELSIGIKMGGKDVQIPALVPTLTEAEVRHLLSGKSPTDEIVRKAAEHAFERQDQGKSPFAQPGESPFMIWDF